MTPEQENELVARWMGWTFSVGNGPYIVGPYWGRGEHEIYRVAPPYRTDPALLWEVMERLLRRDCGGWLLLPGPYSGFVGERDAMATCNYATLAEAVFAAAVMQAEQEGK